MASSPTALLGFELQGSQDNSGTWNVNANGFVQAIEDAIAGSLLLSATSGDTALSVTSYAADQSRLQIIRIGSGGNPITSNRRVTSTRLRDYLVSNETTSGSFTVSFGYDTSNLITIPRGCCCHVRTNSGGTVTQLSPMMVMATGQIDSSSLTALYAKFPVATENIGCAVISSTTATPPGSPTTNDRYIVPVGGLVAWSGQDGKIAVWNGSSWTFTAPANGMLAWDRANHYLVGYDANGWNAGSVTNPLPSGTGMIFTQAVVPTGWTQYTAINQYGIRIVSGTGGVVSGTVNWSTLFARTKTDDHTLITSELPTITPAGSVSAPTLNNGTTLLHGSGVTRAWTYNTGSTESFQRPDVDTTVTANAPTFTGTPFGSNVGHSHDIDMRLKTLDVIIGTRN